MKRAPGFYIIIGDGYETVVRINDGGQMLETGEDRPAGNDSGSCAQWYGPLDLKDLSKHQEVIDLERARRKIMDEYSKFWTDSNTEPKWAKDSEWEVGVLRLFPAVALKACAIALYGDVYNIDIHNPIHDEYHILLTRRLN